jgi:hypothetical protein
MALSRGHRRAAICCIGGVVQISAWVYFWMVFCRPLFILAHALYTQPCHRTARAMHQLRPPVSSPGLCGSSPLARGTDQLVSWALPVELASDSTMLVELIKAGQGDKGLIEAVMPSKAPVFIAVVYKGQAYYPMVIESCGMSLDDPITADGDCITRSLTLQICSLTAIDRRDWAATRTSNL